MGVIMMVLNFVLAFIVLFCVGILAAYQIYCLVKNQTNIEAWERGKVETLVKRGKIPPVSVCVCMCFMGERVYSCMITKKRRVKTLSLGSLSI